MNWHLFSAFLLITAVLVIVPGPIVTLVIATGASRGIRAALQTVDRHDIGQRRAARLHRARLELDPEDLGGNIRLRALGRRGLSRLARHPGLAPRRRARRSGAARRRTCTPGAASWWRSPIRRPSPSSPPSCRSSSTRRCRSTRQLVVMCSVSVVLAGFLDAAWGVAAGFGRAFLMKPRHNRCSAGSSGAVLIGGGIWLSLQRRPV